MPAPPGSHVVKQLSKGMHRIGKLVFAYAEAVGMLRAEVLDEAPDAPGTPPE
jgi:hypothetical protein